MTRYSPDPATEHGENVDADRGRACAEQGPQPTPTEAP